jgi:hypothetical protein
MLTIISTALSDIGVYTISSTATIPSNMTGMSTALAATYSFSLTVESGCLSTVINDKEINNMLAVIGQNAVKQDVSF